jgi:hypothetical protein
VDNPFLKRATERLRDDEAFLAIVSPEPVSTFLQKYGETGELYEPLVIIRGAPGSGKTTLARLFQFRTVATLLRNRQSEGYKPLLAVLTECRALEDGTPRVLACRLPMESTYRDLWEFPYPEELRTNLLTALVQARAVLAWLRELEGAGVDLDSVRVVPREDAAAALEFIGGPSGVGLRARARDVERGLYDVAGALVAPSIDALPHAATGAYRPFDVIEHVEVTLTSGGEAQAVALRPLVILDDAHALHPQQFRGLQHWFTRRELRVARWMLTRLDILTPTEVLRATADDGEQYGELPGISRKRDVIEIWLQSSLQDRRRNRTAFRRMAKDMASRYLRQMPLFRTKDLTRLDDLLATAEPTLSPSELADLQRRVDSAQRKLHITPSRRAAFDAEVTRYSEKARDAAVPPDVRLATVLIMMHRYANRIPQSSLFGTEDDPEPQKPVRAKKDILDGARLQLMHRYDRPYYFGIDTLCDASSENAEQFLRLAALLVDQSATQLTRGRAATISPTEQHSSLRKCATDLVQEWNFPYQDRVRRLTDAIASRCVDMSMARNARLGAGANAYGIPVTEFETLTETHLELARVLQFAVAYNALTLVPNYTCQDEQWCLLELGGLVSLRYGLTLQRGGFLRGTVEELDKIMAASLTSAAERLGAS